MKSVRGFVPVLILLALAILGLVAYFGYSYLKPKEISTVPTPIVSSEPVAPASQKPVVDETANWETYTGKIFTFKYPSGVTINSRTQGKEELFEIKGLEKDIALVIDPIEDHNFYIDKQISKTIKYNNISWNLLTGSQQFCDGGECSKISDALQVEYRGKRYSIVLGDLNYPNAVLDQILSTFRFTD